MIFKRQREGCGSLFRAIVEESENSYRLIDVSKQTVAVRFPFLQSISIRHTPLFNEPERTAGVTASPIAVFNIAHEHLIARQGGKLSHHQYVLRKLHKRLSAQLERFIELAEPYRGGDHILIDGESEIAFGMLYQKI